MAEKAEATTAVEKAACGKGGGGGKGAAGGRGKGGGKGEISPTEYSGGKGGGRGKGGGSSSYITKQPSGEPFSAE